MTANRNTGTQDSDGEQSSNKRSRLGALQVLGSVFAAALGIQSSDNRERDFKQGRAGVFIAAGITFTVLFIVIIATVVHLVLRSAGN
ncbi:MAG: DUF2970 domain-containing protein [Halioglobus sp.]|nr:DUF2970 domain-containing protein [Halioglobus sp.]